MLRSFAEVLERARAISAARTEPMRIAAAAGEDEASIIALDEARREGLARPIIVGEREVAVAEMARLGIDPAGFGFVEAAGLDNKAEAAVSLVRTGGADVLMKGMLPTSTFLHPVFVHGTGLLPPGGFVSHVGFIEWREAGRLILQTDGGLNIAPDIGKKKGMIINAVAAARMLGIERPKVALISATEKVHSKILSSVDAGLLSDWARDALPDADVDGPLSFDIAVSAEAAAHKGVTGPVAGRADILVGPDIETQNVVYKAFRYLAHAEGAGILVGAACPVVLASRSDSPREKLNSIALAVVYAASKNA